VNDLGVYSESTFVEATNQTQRETDTVINEDDLINDLPAAEPEEHANPVENMTTAREVLDAQQGMAMGARHEDSIDVGAGDQENIPRVDSRYRKAIHDKKTPSSQPVRSIPMQDVRTATNLVVEAAPADDHYRYVFQYFP
jgi:hypothetical protein